MRQDGRYCVKIKMDDGSYKYCYGSTMREANKKADEIKARLRQGERIAAGDRPLSWWAERFIAHKETAGLSPRYFGGLSGRVKWWSDRIGDIPISKVEVSDIQAGIDDKAEDGAAKKTIKEYINTAHAIFDYAARERAITYNPAQYAELPQKATKTERYALTDTEIGWVNTTPHRAKLAAMLMLYTGIRRGELLALRTADIDLSQNILHVDKAIYFDGNNPHMKRGGKTDCATRDIPIPERLAKYLLEEFTVREPFELLYHMTDGRPMTERSWRRMWDSYLTDLNAAYGGHGGKSKYTPGGLPFTIRPFTPHCLRHTYATMLHAAGVDVLTAKKLLGHSDIVTTLRIYTHLDEISEKKDAKKLDEYLRERA